MTCSKTILFEHTHYRKFTGTCGCNPKKAVLFVMTDDTRNGDDVAEYLQLTYPEFADQESVLVIHTKNNGEVAEQVSGKKEDELRALREAANRVDDTESPHALGHMT